VASGAGRLGPEEITTKVTRYQQEFHSRLKVQAIYKVGVPYQRSVIDRFGTVAAALRMAIEVGLLRWKSEDTDAGIEACVVRWADYDKMNPVVIAIVRFMGERQSWEGTASQLLKDLSRLSNGVVESPEALGRWLKKPENLQRLEMAGVKIAETRDRSRNRTKLIRIERIEEE
jgi:hypothetical protein